MLFRSGESDLRVLDFDHNDPDDKIGNVTEMALGGNNSWEKIEKEIKKCTIRCSNCHRKKTIGRPDWFLNPVQFIAKAHYEMAKRKIAVTTPSVIVHGTRSGYHKEARRKIKHCVDCKKANTVYANKFWRKREKHSPLAQQPERFSYKEDVQSANL